MADDPLAGVKADLTSTSAQISTQVRTLMLGVLAFVWLFLSGAKDIPTTMVAAMPKTCFLAISIIAISSLLADLLQYVAGYFCSKGVLKEAERTGADPSWNDASLLYRARNWLYSLKLLLALLAVVTLLALLLKGVTS